MKTFKQNLGNNFRALTLICPALLLVLFFSSALYAQQPFEVHPEDISWNISALSAVYDQERDLYVARGEVVIIGGKTRLEADYVEFNNKTKDAFATGNVLLISGEDTVTCNNIRLNLASQTGTIYQGVVFIHENHFYIQGDQIEKTGEKTYTASEATLTTCQGSTPDWRIFARDISVTIEGYGIANHASFWTKSIPVLYTPLLVFPVKTNRQTGFLTPRISLSDRNGFEVDLPFFIAISRNSDATLSVNYMEERGTKIGAEYRYLLKNNSFGALYFDYLSDQVVDDGTPATQEYSYPSTPARTNSDRYWFRMKHDINLGAEWTAKLDIDIVSDADYLLDFRDGITGFDDVNHYFESTFGRSLDDYNDTTRTNRLNFNRLWPSYSLNAGVYWIDDVILRQQESDNPTLQELPSVRFTGTRQSLFNSGIYIDFETEYTYFYRQDNTDDLSTGHRTDIYPRLLLPLKFGKFASFESFAGIRETLWEPENFSNITGDDKSIYHREMFDFGAELSSVFSRVFHTNTRYADKINHEIIPALGYSYVQDVDQEEFPQFDALDRIEKQNQLTWSLTNRFIRKTFMDTPGTGDPMTKPAAYKEFAWIKLSQGYLMDEDEKHENNDHAFSDIEAETEFHINDYVSLDADAQWSPYDNRFSSHNAGITLISTRGDSFYCAHRYTESTSESFYTRISTRINDRLSAFVSHEENLFEDTRIETATGIDFKRNCWSLAISYSDKPDDRSISFMINLYGIGALGSQ